MMPSNPQDTDALIDHILSRYHAVHRQQVPELTRLARLVEKTHADHPDTPHGLAALLASIASEMEAHMRKEEEGLFPELRRRERDMASAVDLMRDEHEDHTLRLKELEILTHGHKPPEDACGNWRALYAGTAQFAVDLREHIRLENELLFPCCGG